MTNNKKCSICHAEFEDSDRVIFSSRETFVYKPLDVPDTLNPAQATPEALYESRKDHLRTAVVNTFCDWGRAEVPESAFHFRHQWCEPVRTGAGVGAHPVSKHAIRFNRAAPGRLHG